MSFSKSPHQPFSLRAQLQSALVLFGVGVSCLVAGYSLPNVVAQEKEAVAADTAKLPALPASALPLEFVKGEKVAFLGNSQAERMNLFGNFETYLHLQFPDRGLVVRNFGRPAEEVDAQQRSADYTAIDDPLKEFNADTYICFFGFNESYAGVDSVGQFKDQYKNYLNQIARQYPRNAADPTPRFVLVSPIAFEPTDSRFLPTGVDENQRLAAYTAAIEEVAKERKLAFIDVFTPTLKLFNEKPGMQFTINGCHLNEEGDAAVAKIMVEKLLKADPAKLVTDKAKFEKLRSAINDKSWVHLQDYRMLNGWYVYGGRRTWDKETFPLEYAKIRKMAAVRDQYCWDIALGKAVPSVPNDEGTGDLHVPPTRFGNPGQNYSEAEELRYLTPDQFIAETKVPPGFKIELFADETKFPDIAKPVQLNFDNKGRAWLACMPTYPQWKPGDPRPGDKLVILEDTDNDGKADVSKVFYDKLHCPTGFEFFDGGVLVVDQPRMLFLKDTDGDDKADLVVHLMDGWASDDTHHTCGAFEWNNGGLLHMLEGIATSTTLETPWGPHRSKGDGGAYVMDPRTLKIRQFSLPGQYNMWCYVFNQWGQGIVGDGTTANHAWDTPLSGAQFRGRQGLNFVFNNEGMRPALGCEFLISRNFPDEVQGQFTYACVINMNGMPRFTVNDDGGGYNGARLKNGDGSPDDLIRSSDKHFRPADPQIGPDGALWFGDWANALIGHMQYSQRDPNRDHVRGRLYRLVYADKPLVKPVTQFGKSVPELLEQLSEYEWRTRYRARRELRDRPTDEVIAATKTWLNSKDPNSPDYDRYCSEALWIQQSHHRVDVDLLTQVLKSAKTPEARAAAVRIAADMREEIPQAEELLISAAADAHPRVQTESARGLSFFPTKPAMKALFSMTSAAPDYWRDYTIQHALGPNESAWIGDFVAGNIEGAGERATQIVNNLMSSSKTGAAALPHLQVLLSQQPKPAEERNKAMTALTEIKGDVNRGREVFVRNCTACHKVGNGDGREFGPNLAGVAKRMVRLKIIESIVDPNSEVAEKYRSTAILTDDGTVITGLLVAETDEAVEIFDGKETRKIMKDEIEERKVQQQSSMPEGAAGTVAPSEFVDLIEYLSAQNQDVKP
jgi:putative heme-binding domain-containing protein